MNITTAPALAARFEFSSFKLVMRAATDLARVSQNLKDALVELEQCADRVREMTTLNACYAQTTSNGDIMNSPTVAATRVAMFAREQNAKIEQLFLVASVLGASMTVEERKVLDDEVEEIIQWICHHKNTYYNFYALCSS